MNPMEAEGLAGAGLTPAIERLRNLCSLSEQMRVDSIRLDLIFAGNLTSLLERCRDTLESQSDEIIQLLAVLRSIGCSPVLAKGTDWGPAVRAAMKKATGEKA